MKRIAQIIAVLLVSQSHPLLAQDERSLNEQNARNPQTHALVVGVSKYQSHPIIQNLNYADDDARAVAAYLKSKSGGAIPLDQIIELYDTLATGAAIMETLRYYDRKIMGTPAEINKGDKLFIYLAGHGGTFETEDSYFFPTNASNALDADVAVSMRTLKNYIENWCRKQIQVTFIFDACRSARADMGKESIRRVSDYLEKRQTGETLLIASTGGQESLELTEIGHGLFTYFLLNGLYGMADEDNDNKILGRELSSYLDQKVGHHSNGDQEPTYVNLPKNQVFATVDPADKARFIKSQTGSLDANLILSASRTVTKEKNERTNPVLSKTEIEFKKALQQNRLVYPDQDCAVFYFEELSNSNNKNLIKLKLDLTTALLNSAQQTLLNDINGLRLYIRATSITTLTEGYNIRYYRDALLALQHYNRLTQSKSNDDLSCLQTYLKARDEVMRTGSLSLKEIEAVNSKNILTLQDAIKKCSEKAYLYHALAQNYLEQKNYTETIRLCRRTINLAPNWSFPYNTIGVAFLHSGHLDSAYNYFIRGKKINPDDSYLSQGLSSYYRAKSDFQRAENIDQLAHAKDPFQPLILVNLILDNRLLKNQSMEKKLLNELIVLDPENSLPWAVAGDYYYFTRRMLDSAIFYYKKAIKINPHISGYHLGLAYSYFEINDINNAVIAASNAITVNEKAAGNYHALALCYQKQDKYLSALDNITIATELDSTVIPYKILKSQLLFTQKEYSQVIKTLNRIAPLDASTILILSESYLVTGDLGKSEKLILESKELFDSDFKNCYYILARIKAAQRIFPEALEFLDKALDQTSLSESEVNVAPEFSELKKTKEFRKLMSRYGYD